MRRLTKRNEIGWASLNLKCPEGCKYVTSSFEEGYQCQHQCEGDIIEKLAEYEDLEEQDLLLRLPCKVGDTVYYIEDNKVSEFIVYSFDIRALQWFVCNYEGIRLNFKNFGKTVFITQAEAEQKLKKMEGDRYVKH